MVVDRRSFTLAAIVTLAQSFAPASCAPAKEARSVPPTGLWKTFRARFLDQSGRIVDTGNNRISHSEGQGYGLILAAIHGDHDGFEAIAKWTEANLARGDVALHSWKFDPSAAVPVADINNATDGDMLIAWGLAKGGQRWNNAGHLARSAAIREAIRTKLVVQRHGFDALLPGLEGFVRPDTLLLNPSYFVWPALDVFAQLDGASTWKPVIESCANILHQARFGAYDLPCDWVELLGPDMIAPSKVNPPRFGYDAIRVPLYAVAAKRANLVEGATKYWRDLVKSKSQIPAWIDVYTGETANYPLSNGGKAVVARVTGTPAPAGLDTDYFSAVLQMFAHDVR
ncbi:glycosyl hydrolase family 8 [Novosphingobium sp.]|uniref:glycosyl hydrolase family 8 n=1 Tax=Novosphingobium sp. TaxID=1874826 RepID=UPI0038BD6CB7